MKRNVTTVDSITSIFSWQIIFFMVISGSDNDNTQFHLTTYTFDKADLRGVIGLLINEKKCHNR